MEQTLERIRSYIERDDVREGDRLTEKELCDIAGAGRGTVREAIRILASQGVLETRPRVGTFVAGRAPLRLDTLSAWSAISEMDTGTLQDLMEVRSALEILAARRAVQRRSAEQVMLLRSNQKKAVAAAEKRDFSEQARCDEEFHRIVFAITGDTLLIETNKLIAGRLTQFRMDVFRKAYRPGRFIADHAGIIQAIEDRDVELGEKEMRLHMGRVTRELKTGRYGAQYALPEESGAADRIP